MAKSSVISNFEAEQSVLGAMIESVNMRSEALGVLTCEDFYEKNVANRNVFNAISRIVDSGRTVDITTITDELINMKVIDETGGVNYLLELQETYIGERHALYHLNIVRDLSLVRKFLNTLNTIEKDYKTKQIKSIPEFVAESEKQILDVTKARRSGAFKSTSEVVDKVTMRLKMESGKRKNSLVTGLDTGFTQLNKLTQGFQPGEFIVLAARPSVGKTALAINLAYNIASLNNKTVAFFSLEMTAEDIISRLLASKAQINSRDLKLANLNESDWLALSEGVEAIKKTNILIDDTAGITINEIRTKCQKLKAQDENLGLVVIDYIGLIRTPNSKVENRHLEVGEISRSLKALAKELQLPILCLCQVRREVQDRKDRTPLLSDLRDSGSIEQDADQVHFIYRPNYQRPEELRKDSQKEDDGPLSRCEETHVYVAKNRNGQTGVVYLNFLMNISRFIEIDRPTNQNNGE